HGEKIELGKRTLEVVMTPGHAPDALCLLDREHRLLFTGDTFYPASLYAHLPASDFDAYAQTAAMLGQFFDEVDKLLPAHNEPLVGRVYLRRMHEGFKAIQDSTIEFKVTDGNHEYMFEGFSIIVNVSN
ncbi:MBL fold metallo-hydrolase, partial [candidate division KSB1 bacterium]|nr:MBL fold metallo-hydrolase [candidate division KSB1 bacterium]